MIRVQMPVRWRVALCHLSSCPRGRHWTVTRNGLVVGFAPSLPDAYAVIEEVVR